AGGRGRGVSGGRAMMVWRFRRLIDAYGADPARWPPPERAAALALLATSAQARAALEAARRLDGLLAADQTPVADASLAALVIARATAQSQEWLVRSGRRVEAGRRGLPPARAPAPRPPPPPRPRLPPGPGDPLPARP